MKKKKWITAVLITGWIGWTAPLSMAASGFSFTGPEIFPIENLISNLRSADINGDGLQDIIVVNNLRSKINFLINRTNLEPEEIPADDDLNRRDVNRLPPDSRFILESLSSEKRIAALIVEDLNQDGRADLAYYGDPRELVLQYREEETGWTSPRRFPIRDGILSPNAMTTGDLNGDGKPDLVLLGESRIYCFYQEEDGLGEPEYLPYDGAVKSLQVLDIDGNGLDDLLLVNWEHSYPFRFRLQSEPGQLSPEHQFEMTAIRSYWAQDLDGDNRTEVITIAQQSGKAQIFNFTVKDPEKINESLDSGQFHVLPLSKTSRSRRGVAWGLMNGDTFKDLLVSEPDSGEISYYPQTESGQLANPQSFPTLTGVTSIETVDWNQSGQDVAFLMSPDEGSIGRIYLDENGRFPFPELIPLNGTPLAQAAAPGCKKEGSKPTLAVITKDEDSKRHLLLIRPEEKTMNVTLSESFKSNPSSMHWHDADQDGLQDLVILIPYEKIKILRQSQKDVFEELDLNPPGGTTSQPWLNRSDVDGDGLPELLLAQRNFVRALVLEPSTTPFLAGSESEGLQWRFRVKEQINGSSGNSRINGATPIRNSDGDLFLVLHDAENRHVTVAERQATGLWETIKSIPIPNLEIRDFGTIELGSNHGESVYMISPGSVSWKEFAGPVWELKELDSYETPIEDGFLLDVVSGDLNRDGRQDLVFLETARHYLDIVTFEKPNQLQSGNRWQVFEERSFRNLRNEIPEPREAVIADFTDDGINDLAVLVHDRILLYPQKPSEEQAISIEK